MDRRAFLGVIAGGLLPISLPGEAQQVEKTWSIISKNTVQDVELPFRPDGNRANIMVAWSGAIWDGTARRMLIFGGGHHDYSGNEVCAFSPDTGLWTLFVPPSPAPAAITAGPAAYPDGTPASRHSYSGITFVPWHGAAGGMFVYSGSAWSLGGWGQEPDTWMLDFGTRKWTRLANAPAGYVAAMAACDPSTRTIWIVTMDGRLCRYDAANNKWGVATSFPNGSDAGATLVYHPVMKKLYAAGMTTFTPPKVFDVTKRTPSVSDFRIAGPKMSKGGPVLVADPIAAVLYTVDQGVVWQIDAHTGRGVALPPGGVTPTAENGQGTYGRGQLDPQTRKLLLVNRINEPVFAYQLPV